VWIPLSHGEQRVIRAGRGAVCCALVTSLLFSATPLGLSFWDPGSFYHWKKLYIPGPRAAAFDAVLPQIPVSAHVASTDYIHPRFTHHERSYDYSDYSRKIAGENRRVPEDTDYIVIDTQHYNSRIRTIEEIPELQTEPERWEVLPDQTDGYFMILKRRSP